MSGPLVVAAPAKLNLFLHVGEQRPDRYHDLQSLVAFARIGDEIYLEAADGLALSLDGPFGRQLPRGDNNLVLRAARLLAETAGTTFGARIGLRKNLPLAAGLGGGSADAAAVLRGLNGLWQLGFERGVLHEIAATLGADVPVCLDSATAWMEGSGERVRALPALPHAGVLLVNPRVAVPTAEAFLALGDRRGVGLPCLASAFPDVRALVRFLDCTGNDLQAPARAIAPVIDEVLREMNRLPDILLARMSGSGATCFGLFADEKHARDAARLLCARYPHWWIVETTFYDVPR